MNTRGKVVVAMSGGVDSSVAACLLHEQGYEVVGFFMRTGLDSGQPVPEDRHRGCCSASDAADARYVAGKLGINFYALNFQKQFDKLVDYFSDEYAAGRTPNPCVVCNQDLKFGRIVDYADSIDAQWIATGHFARIDRRSTGPVLQKAVDDEKDQSYVLFGLDRDVLDRVMFPLGGLTKDEVRREAERFDLTIANKPESVDICFVPDRNYAAIVERRRPDAMKPGPVIDSSGQHIGEHAGVGRYTVGQRRGLGIALGLPVYVTEVDARNNTVQIGPQSELLCAGLIAERLNWLVDVPTSAFRATGKIRYHHHASPCTATPRTDGTWHIAFDDAQSAITPGQAIVLYHGDDCLGGGWIARPDASADTP